MCIECEAYIDHETAEIIEKRAGARIIHVPVPLPAQLMTELNDRDKAGGDNAAGDERVPPPPLPSPAYHFNKKIPMRPADARDESP